MPFWLRALVLHLALAIYVLWTVQHVTKLRAYGWTASMGLTDKSQLFVAATIIALGIVYFMQIRVAWMVARLWKYWYQSRSSN
jgi:hypothetical protein